MERSLKVRVIKENSSKVTLYFIALNRKMPIPKQVFEERVASGEYEVVGEPQKEESAEEQQPVEETEETASE